MAKYVKPSNGKLSLFIPETNEIVNVPDGAILEGDVYEQFVASGVLKRAKVQAPAPGPTNAQRKAAAEAEKKAAAEAAAAAEAEKAEAAEAEKKAAAAAKAASKAAAKVEDTKPETKTSETTKA